jgi:shikimate dehydrogenase
MSACLGGATRLFVIVGDPIAQVKSPGGITAGFAQRGVDAVLVPVQVAPADIDTVLRACDRIGNLDGIVATIPHKFAAFSHCTTTSDRSRILRACNVLRRRPDRSWHGDMLDGVGYVRALQGECCEPAGARALLVGAGGAGTAIALGLLEAGVRELAIHDLDPSRRDALLDRLAPLGLAPVRPGSADPSGFDLVVNASPAGMRPGDPLPLDASRLTPAMVVGCVVTVPAQPPLIAEARRLGCRTVTGTQFFEASRELLVDFLLGREPD